MKEKENITYIRQRLEPSSELKRRVLERASELEAGRKTFGNEKTAADKRQTNKEQIKMNANNTNGGAFVKKRFPIAVISAAACVALIVGIAAADLNRNKVTPVNENTQTSSAAELTENQGSSENVMTVTDVIGSGCTITDESRIAAVNALVEKVMECPVRTGDPLPVCRTIVYYAGGEKRTVELSDEGWSFDRDSEGTYHTVTVNGVQYLIKQDSADSIYYDLMYAAEKDSPLCINGSCKTWDEAGISKALELIGEIRSSGTAEAETEPEKLSYETELSLSFTKDGKHCMIELYDSDDMLRIQVYGCRGDEPRSVICKNARKWLDGFAGIIESTESSVSEVDIQDYLLRPAVYSNPEVEGYIRIPGLTNSAGGEYINNEVTRHDDNEYYLTHNWCGVDADAGNIFADCAVPLTEEKAPANITLYGRNVRTDGSMFTHLTDLDDGTGDKLNECSEILFGRVHEDVLARYAVIGVGCIRTEGDFGLGSFNEFDSSRTFESWIDGINSSCSLMRDIDCTADDKYLTLSTNIDAEGGEGWQFAVFARRLREGEELPEGGFKSVRESRFVIPPVEEVPLPELFGLTEAQAEEALEEAGLRCLISYHYDSSTPKGYVSSYFDPYYNAGEGSLVSKGTAVCVQISLGEYEGPTTQSNDEYPYTMPETRNIRLEVPVPEGLSGPYTFSIFYGDSPQYTETVADAANVSSVVFDTYETDKMHLTVYAKSGTDGRGYIRYGDYEADLASGSYKLIGELNTEELLK